MTDKSCKGCKYNDGTDESYDFACWDCSRINDYSCSCHISTPCRVCTNDHYQEEAL